VLIALTLVAAAVILRQPVVKNSAIGWWMASSMLTPERVIPLIGVGAALGLSDTMRAAVILLLFAVGVAVGFLAHDGLLSAIDRLPQAATHSYLTGPISCLAIGIALAPPAKVRFWLAPLAVALVGAMLATAIKLTDPIPHAPTISIAGILIALWIIAAVSLPLWTHRRRWFPIAGRIMGSWLIAIGLLYGGASLVPKRAPPVPDATYPRTPGMSGTEPLPGIGSEVPGSGTPDDRFGEPDNQFEGSERGGLDRFKPQP
jgi:hypothetical protein